MPDLREGCATGRHGEKTAPADALVLFGAMGDLAHKKIFPGEMILPDGKVVAPTGKSFDLDFAMTAKGGGDLLLEEFAFVEQNAIV